MCRQLFSHWLMWLITIKCDFHQSLRWSFYEFRRNLFILHTRRHSMSLAYAPRTFENPFLNQYPITCTNGRWQENRCISSSAEPQLRLVHKFKWQIVFQEGNLLYFAPNFVLLELPFGNRISPNQPHLYPRDGHGHAVHSPNIHVDFRSALGAHSFDSLDIVRKRRWI